MKNKLGIIFFVCAVIAILVIFKYVNTNSLNPEKSAQTQQQTPTKESLTQFMKNNTWTDYASSEIKIKPEFFDSAKTTYIHLWASWCAPCVNEVPELISFAQKSSDQVKFITISLDDDINELSKFLISFPDFNSDRFIKIFDKDKKMAQFINADRLPMTIKVSGDELKEIRSVVDWKSIAVEK